MPQRGGVKHPSLSFSCWLGDNGGTYLPGAEVPAGVSLTAQWQETQTSSGGNDDDDDDDDGGGSASVVRPPVSGIIYEGGNFVINDPENGLSVATKLKDGLEDAGSVLLVDDMVTIEEAMALALEALKRSKLIESNAFGEGDGFYVQDETGRTTAAAKVVYRRDISLTRNGESLRPRGA